MLKAKCDSRSTGFGLDFAQGDDIIPIPGTRKIERLVENAGAVDLHLTAADLAEIEAIIARYPNMGARYNAQQLAAVNH